MTNKETIKYIDLIIKDIDDFDCFSVNNIVFEYLKPESKEGKEQFFVIIDKIKLFGKNNDIFVPRTKDGWCKLTDKGKRLKLSKKSFKRFEKSENKTEWYNKNWVGYLIAFILLLFTVYQHFDNRSLKQDFDSLSKKYDSLKHQSDFYKDSVSELKQQLERQKLKLKKDTLSKSYHSDLKN